MQSIVRSKRIEFFGSEFRIVENVVGSPDVKSLVMPFNDVQQFFVKNVIFQKPPGNEAVVDFGFSVFQQLKLLVLEGVVGNGNEAKVFQEIVVKR